MSIVEGADWFDIIDHDAVLDAMAGAGLSVSWEFPGLVRIELDPTTSVATGLHGYEYGSVSILKDNMWDESTEPADVAVSEGETDPKVIATAWATWVRDRTGTTTSSS
jgi:hypothetical protein